MLTHQPPDVAHSIFPLLPPDSQAPPEYRREMAEIKRFLEYWSADPAFRQELPHDPRGVARAAGLSADPEDIRLLWSLDPHDRERLGEPTPAVVRYRAFIAEKIDYRTRMRSQAGSPHAGFQAWRKRQIQRCFGQLGRAKGEALVHAGMALELSRGCSVGCWFCGVSALKFDGVWPRTAENVDLWRQVLSLSRASLGQAAERGFCYWATDPLDNPQYEDYCLDFARIVGCFPQTTTAQPLKDPARFRLLHKMSRENGNAIDRFSVLSLGTLRKIFAEYSAEELLLVELVPQMEGAYASKAYAGKARAKQEKWNKTTGREVPPEQESGTIACVSGLLVRMPEQSFELISPCPADQRWPNGYRIYARRSFKDAADFGAQLAQVLDALPLRVPLDQPLRFRRDLQLQLTPTGFQLCGHHWNHGMGSEKYAAMASLGKALLPGHLSAMELALRVEAESSLEETLALLNQLFAAGLFDDEP